MLNNLLLIITLSILNQVSAQSHQSVVCYDELLLINNVPLLQKSKDQIENQRQESINYIYTLENTFNKEIDRLSVGCHPEAINKEKEKEFNLLLKTIERQFDSVRKDYFAFEKLQLLKIENSIQISISEYVQEKQILRPYRKAYLDCHELGNDITDQLITYFIRKK